MLGRVKFKKYLTDIEKNKIHNFSFLEVLNDTRSNKQFDRFLRISLIPHKIRLTNFFINESESVEVCQDVRSKSLFVRKITKKIM